MPDTTPMQLGMVLINVHDDDSLTANLVDAFHAIALERQRQVHELGFTTAHDDAHACDEIAAGAACWAMPPACRRWSVEGSDTGDLGPTVLAAIYPHEWWPLPRALEAHDEPTTDADRKRELVKAAAMIVAEIERIDRVIARGATS